MFKRIVCLAVFLLSINVVFAATQKVFWCVQIASSSDLPELKALFGRVPPGIDNRIERVGPLYTLRSGLFYTKEEAEQLKSALVKNGLRNVLVRTCYFVKERIVYPETIQEIRIQPESSAATEAPSSEITVQDDSSFPSDVSLIAKHRDELEQILKEVKKEVLQDREMAKGGSETVERIFSIPGLEPSVTRADLLLKIAKKEAESRNTGLKFTAQYTQNENINLIEEDDTVPYKWRAYLGLEWDILRDGFRQHRLKKRSLEEALQADSILFPVRMGSEMYPYLRNSIIFIFNNAKKEKLKMKIEFLSRYTEILKDLYFSALVPLEDVQNAEKELWRARKMLEGYTGYEENLPASMKKELGKINAALLPVFNVDIEKMRKAIEDPALRSRILAHQEASVSLGYKSDYNIRFAPYVRYYLGDATKFSDYFSFGVLVNVPLPPGKDKTEKVKETEYDYLKSSYDRTVRDSVHDVLNTYYEYSYKLDDLVKFLFQKEELLERLRKELVRFDFRDPSFSARETLAIYAQYLDTDFEILHIKQLLYLHLAFLAKYVPEFSITPYVIPVNTEKDIKMNAKQRSGERSLYIWSEAFNSIENESLLWFLKTKSIKHALISFGKKTDRKKLAEFLKLAGGTVSVEALLGDNGLLSDREKLQETFAELSSYQFQGLHLDVEPHTLADWKTQSAKYLNQYIEMLKTVVANPWMKGRVLSISIPVFYPEEALKQIFPLVDTVYVMPYETKNPDTVAQRIKEEIGIDRTKIVIALRVKDFESELELENFISTLQNRTGVSSFALHSLTEYLENIGGSHEIEGKTNIH